MKSHFFIAALLFSTFSFAQIHKELEAFEVIDSNIGATLYIVKASQHKIEISGDDHLINTFFYTVKDKGIKFRSGQENTDYSSVYITLYTPTISALEMTHGGKATLDGSFSRMDHFEVSATQGAKVDISRVEFKSLVAESSGGGEVIYKPAPKPTKKTEPLDEAKSIQ